MNKIKIFKKYNYLVFGLFLVLSACNSEEKETSEKPNEAEKFIASVEQEYAPDSRVALFDVEAVKNSEAYVLKGESNLPDAVSSLKSNLEEENIAYVDSIQMLPSEELEGKTKGVIKISVANIRDESKHSAQLVTQATLGTPVNVLKKDGSWYYIQTPDDYLGWTDYGGVTPISEAEFEEWHSAEKIIFLKPFGFSYQEPNAQSQEVSDLVAGNILEVLGEENGFYKIKYPDGREAFIEKVKAQPYLDWLASLDQTGQDFIETSKSLMGLPYLWGGTSSKGVDCSGFTKTIYFLNGIVLPRDASQQIRTGVVVDSTKNFENLQVGDLLFFGRPATDTSRERVIHVGMWIGDNQFIHSMGDVHISTFDTTATDFDEYNYNRYLRTKRILGQEHEELIQLTQSELFIDKLE